MERRQSPSEEDLDLPKPWEDRVITRAQWEHHRSRLMSRCCGDRPAGWWLYERNVDPPRPYQQARILFAMGELAGAELKQCMDWWRANYDDAHETDEPRTKYWRWHDIPPSLIKQWDRERE